ncbi:unnamed protein product [Staurois parvus]|uniref:Uncharacterized protein n=1 Tax=Staurois parvus TaxID=386267 RepID=A0ABN9H5U3_9NEOB|nr:unnamed protein product [Staurois parvus]
MGCSQELREFKCGTVIGCHLCNRSIHDISLLLIISWSTVSCITKWKQLGTTASRPRKRTEQGQRMQKSTAGPLRSSEGNS